MKWILLHTSLLEILKEKVPQRAKLVEILTDILSIEKDAVYRRLRGEVPFSLVEAIAISNRFNFSLDNLIQVDTTPNRPFMLKLIEYTNLLDMDYCAWEDYITLIRLAKDDPYSEIAESSNLLPISLYGKFGSLAKFYLVKWQYMFSRTERPVQFGKFEIPERLQNIYRSYFDESKHIAHSTYIWDHLIFQYLANDIKFFLSINLLTQEDIPQIKKDLYDLLDYTEDIVAHGKFEETGKEVMFYISDINLEADYSFVKIADQKISLVRTFILYSIASTDEKSFEKIQDWIQSLKKSSTLITKSGEIHRIQFFNKQREIISGL